MTSKQQNYAIDLFRFAIQSLDLSKEAAEEFIENPDTRIELKKVIAKLSRVDQLFGTEWVDIDFTVPADYIHDTQIDAFVEQAKKLKSLYHFDEGLTSKNFAGATNRLVPGETYRVRIFPILTRVSSKDCLDFLAKQGAVFVNAQGGALIQKNMPEIFPIGKFTVSFDEEESFWVDAGGFHRVFCVGRDSDGHWRFHLADFENAWCADHCLLCVSNK